MLRKSGDLRRALDEAQRAALLRPRDPAVHVSLGSVELELGRHHAAATSFSTAIDLRPNDLSAIAGLAEAAIALNDYTKAESALYRGLAIEPRNSVLHDRLALALHCLDRHTEAIEAARRAIEFDPGAGEYWLRLGDLLVETGEIGAAHDAFKTALSLKPSLVLAMLGLIRTTADISRRAGHLEALDRFLARAAELGDFDRIGVHLALFEIYDGLGRYDDAFPHLARANALKRAMTGYDEAATLGVYREVGKLITAEIVRAKTGAGSPSAVPIFVLGMPRSGTTLVEQILASHPLVSPGGEQRILAKLAANPAPFGGTGPYPFFVPDASPSQFMALAEAYLHRTPNIGPAARHLTDKMPGNALFLGLIHLMLPNAKIILVKRDPMDTCFSCFSKFLMGSMNYTYDLQELGRFYRAHEALMSHWRRVLPQGAFLEVRYENVVAGVEGEARRLLEYCGLKWDPRVLEFHKTARSIRTVSAQQVRRPIYRSSIGRWRHYRAFLEPLRLALDAPVSEEGPASVE